MIDCVQTLWDEAGSNIQITYEEDINGDLLVIDKEGGIPGLPFYSAWVDTPKTTGKWYWELTVSKSLLTNSPRTWLAAGISRRGEPLSPPLTGNFQDNDIKENNTVYRTDSDLYAGNDTTSWDLQASGTFILGFLLDLDNFTFNIQVNGEDMIPGELINDGNLAFTAYYPYVALQQARVEANFGSKLLTYGPPVGFLAYDSIGLTSGSINVNPINESLPNTSMAQASTINDTTTKSINIYSTGMLVNPPQIPLVDDDIHVVTEVQLENRSSGRLSG